MAETRARSRGGSRTSGTDLVPELLETIRRRIAYGLGEDRVIRRTEAAIRKGTAEFSSLADAQEQLGKILSGSLQSVLTWETLPEGKLYYNIASRTITPALQEGYRISNSWAVEVQGRKYREAGLELQPVQAAWPEERIRAVASAAADRETLEEAHILIDQAVRNITMSYLDDFVAANAAFAERAGMEATITRTTDGSCCPWCDALAGTYVYGEHPRDIFLRHNNCNCRVTYTAGRLMQDSHSKRWYSAETQNAMDARELGSLQPKTWEEARAIEQAMEARETRLLTARREQLIRSMMERDQVSHRRAANRLTRGSR